MDRLPFIPLDTEVPPYGKVAAVGFKDGERFYMFVDEGGGVTLMPGDLMRELEEAMSYPVVDPYKYGEECE